MSAAQLHALVVGFGDRVQRVLLPALRTASTPVRVTAVCDPVMPTPQHFESLKGDLLLAPEAAMFDNLEDALQAPHRYDVALLACPHDLHYPTTLRLAEHGITVWKEKPFALNLYQALDLAERAADLRMLAHRPHGQLYKIAEALLPSLGRLLSYDIRIARQTSDYSTTWRASRQRSGGGAIIDLGYHAADLIARLAPEPDTVYAVTGRPPAHRTPVEVEESAHLTLTHPGGCVGTVYVSRCDDHADDIDLIAEHGRITITGGTARIQALRRGGTDTVKLTADDNPWAEMLRHHSQTHRDTAVTAAEVQIGVRATALIQAAYASLVEAAPAPVTPITARA
jgi:predicted dehydrogenase